MQLTTPMDNLTDLLNLSSQVAFRARVPRHIVLANMKAIIDEQYFQEIVKSVPEKTKVLK